MFENTAAAAFSGSTPRHPIQGPIQRDDSDLRILAGVFIDRIAGSEPITTWLFRSGCHCERVRRTGDPSESGDYAESRRRLARG